MANSILYGLLNQKDLAGDLTAQNLAIEIDRDLIVIQVGETVGQHNAEVNALRGLFAENTTDYTLRYEGYLSNNLQEGDENTDPDPVKGAAYYSVGFPLRDAYTAWGANWITWNQLTLREFSDRTEQMLTGDINWHRKWMFGTLLFDGLSGTGPGTSPFTFVDPKYGSISVYGLANGDTATYEKYTSAAPATDTHYTAQNGAISDTSGQNPFPTIETALLEHPSNSGPLVAFIDPALATSIRALASFVPSPTFVGLANPSPGSTAKMFGGRFPSIPLPPSAQVIGEVGNIFIVTWRSVPTNHIITIAQSPSPVLKFRQYPQVALQGFGPIDLRTGDFGNKFPYFSQRWHRGGGFGGYNRVGAHVHQVTASTTYAMSNLYYGLFGRTS